MFLFPQWVLDLVNCTNRISFDYLLSKTEKKWARGGKNQSSPNRQQTAVYTRSEASSSPFLSLYETSRLDEIHIVGTGTENSPWLVCVLPGNWKSRSQKESAITVLLAVNNRGATSPGGHHSVNRTIAWPFRGSKNATAAFRGHLRIHSV